MKKTIITVLAMCAAPLALAATSESVAITATPSGTAVSGYYTLKGFTMDFGNSTSYTLDGQSITAGDLADLSDIKLASVAVSFNNSSSSDIYLSVFEVTSTADTTQSNWTITHLGTSSNTGGNASTTHTFNFTPITLDTSKVYAFVYTPNIANSSDVSATTTIAGLASWATYGKRTNVYEDTASNSITIGTGSPGVCNANHTAQATFNITATKTTAAVPEPTTATLSLLALAGLAARRRRQ